MKQIIILSSLVLFTLAQNSVDLQTEMQCPQYWMKFQQSCYRFIKSPLRSRNDARKNCQAYDSDLLSVNSLDEHGFIVYQLLWQDPQHRRWYTSARQQNLDYWINDGDNSQLVNMDGAFLPHQDSTQNKDFLVYSFSPELKKWGFEYVTGNELLLFICEAPINKLHYLVVDDRTYQYGEEVDDPEKIPRGPYFIRQPRDVVYDLSRTQIANDVSLSCLAGGYPSPKYQWFKEEYLNDRVTSTRIDPLTDKRYTVSGGVLIIHDPNRTRDKGTYHCKAKNKYGTIRSESVTLKFGHIAEFNLKRSPENGNQNWGKVLYCDPPTFFPSVNYYWARDKFPNLVEEDKRVFVSFDGGLYFSALENIDYGNYSCNVQTNVSDKGRNGPLFELRVLPNSNYQQLKFPNNFPKAFPEAPVAGREVRLECIAFGYPVPSYNWTRKGASLPRGAITLNYNRALIIPHVRVEDQGEYVCRAQNERSIIENSVILSIQAEPNFTIPLTDRHMDNNADLIWTCEAFGIPDVNYTWYRNGEVIDVPNLPIEDRDRYSIVDNVLTIHYLNPERDRAMYQCCASNQLKARYSSAQLRILSLKPSFKKRPLELETYAAEGGNITIRCNPEAAPKPKFVWKKDGSVLGSGGRRRILENGNLIISPVSRDDGGVYTCSAQNTYGTDESSGRLIILRGPRFEHRMPISLTTSVSEDLELRCQASSEEILDVAYIWTHNGLRIRDTDFQRGRMDVHGGFLSIKNTTLAEAGDYECIVKSAVGRISSKTTIYVRGPPGPPGGVQVMKVTNTTATIEWTDGADNGQPIYRYTISGRTNWNKTWTNLAGNITAREINRNNGRKEAKVERLSPWSSYEFRVAASNEHGYGLPSAPSPLHNTPSDKPYKAPSRVGGGGGKIGDLTITWEPLMPQDQNGPDIYYKIFWRHINDTEFQSLVLKDHGNIGIAVVHIKADNYFTKYIVKVQAGNNLGLGPVSEEVAVYSAEDMPQEPVSSVIGYSFNSTALNVSWSPVDQTREKIRGRLIGHRLKYWKQGIPEESAVYYLSRSTRPWALIVGLQPDTYYLVKVMAYNSAGEGPESQFVIERTYRKAPQKPPSSVHFEAMNPSTVRVNWRYVAPSLEEEPLQGYKVRVWEVDQDMSTANNTIVNVGEKLEAFVTGLSPGKVYHMRVLGFSNGGDGRMSSPTITFQMGKAEAFRSSSARVSHSAALVALLLLVQVLCEL